MKVGRTIRWVAVAAWMALIFGLSSQPNLQVADAPALDFVIRKSGHIVAFGTLAVLLYGAISPAGSGTARPAHVWSALAATVAYAVSDEVHQAFVAGRGPAASDVLIDAIGAALGLLLWRRWAGPWLTARAARGDRSLTR